MRPVWLKSTEQKLRSRRTHTHTHPHTHTHTHIHTHPHPQPQPPTPPHTHTHTHTHTLFAPVVRIQFFFLARPKIQLLQSGAGSESRTIGPLGKNSTLYTKDAKCIILGECDLWGRAERGRQRSHSEECYRLRPWQYI